MARVSYSTIVRGLTVVLPLVALALLSTLFLVARTQPENDNLPFIQELQDRADAAGNAVRTPFFSGTTDTGDAVTLRADLVIPDPTNPGDATAENLRADIQFEDGSTLQVDADQGEYTNTDERLELRGNVVLRSSTGYDLYTSVLIADIAAGEASSPGAVRAEGPPGTIDAGALDLRRKADDAIELVFTNGVKLIYVPGNSSE